MRDALIIEKIKQAIDILDEIDNMIDNQVEELRKVEYKQSDLLHIIENNEISNEGSIEIIKKLHEIRLERRSLHNEQMIESTYQQHKSKIINRDSRKLLSNEIYKKLKQLNNEYKNRVYTDDEINELISPKKKRGRPRKEIKLNV